MPTPDEGDELLGFPRGYTNVPGIEPYHREQMIGNTMHIEAVKRLLKDLPFEHQEKQAATGWLLKHPSLDPSFLHPSLPSFLQQPYD